MDKTRMLAPHRKDLRMVLWREETDVRKTDICCVSRSACGHIWPVCVVLVWPDFDLKLITKSRMRSQNTLRQISFVWPQVWPQTGHGLTRRSSDKYHWHCFQVKVPGSMTLATKAILFSVLNQEKMSQGQRKNNLSPLVRNPNWNLLPVWIWL